MKTQKSNSSALPILLAVGAVPEPKHMQKKISTTNAEAENITVLSCHWWGYDLLQLVKSHPPAEQRPTPGVTPGLSLSVTRSPFCA